jgi:hypothetical protein
MDALDDAAKQEAAREEMARLEAERQKSDAADLVRQMKVQMFGDAIEHVEAEQPDEGTTEPAEPDAEASMPAKTIGSAGGPAEDSDTSETTGKPTPDASEPDAPPARTIGRFGRDERARDTERD